MKKIISLLLVGLILCLCACNKKTDENISDSNTDSTIISDSDAKTDTDTSASSDVATTTTKTASSATNTTPTTAKATSAQKPTPSTPSALSSSNEFLTASTNVALSQGGKVVLTISTHDIASKEVYGMQFSVSFKGMSIESISKNGLPAGWSCSVTDAASANSNGGAIVLLDCDFSNTLDNRDIITITFNSNGGSDAHISVLNNIVMKDKTSFTRITASNINL